MELRVTQLRTDSTHGSRNGTHSHPRRVSFPGWLSPLTVFCHLFVMACLEGLGSERRLTDSGLLSPRRTPLSPGLPGVDPNDFWLLPPAGRFGELPDHLLGY